MRILHFHPSNKYSSRSWETRETKWELVPLRTYILYIYTYPLFRNFVGGRNGTTRALTLLSIKTNRQRYIYIYMCMCICVCTQQFRIDVSAQVRIIVFRNRSIDPRIEWKHTMIRIFSFSFFHFSATFISIEQIIRPQHATSYRDHAFHHVFRIYSVATNWRQVNDDQRSTNL